MEVFHKHYSCPYFIRAIIQKKGAKMCTWGDNKINRILFEKPEATMNTCVYRD